jgi:hypothetical protein
MSCRDGAPCQCEFCGRTGVPDSEADALQAERDAAVRELHARIGAHVERDEARAKLATAILERDAARAALKLEGEESLAINGRLLLENEALKEKLAKAEGECERLRSELTRERSVRAEESKRHGLATEKALAELAVAVEALRWYADCGNYHKLWSDRGERASAALAKLEERE